MTLSNEAKSFLRNEEDNLRKNNIEQIVRYLRNYDNELEAEICAFFYEQGMLKYMNEIPMGFFSFDKMPETVIIPENIKRLKAGAFVNNSNIKKVFIKDGLTTIEELCFSSSDIESIQLPNTLTVIGNGAFNNCKKLKSIFIPDSVQSLGANAFKGCDDIKIYITPSSKRGSKLRFKKSDLEFLKDHVIGVELGRESE